jgi:hypothetical protein
MAGSPAFQLEVLACFRVGLDTRMIAAVYAESEAYIASVLATARDAEHARKMESDYAEDCHPPTG